MTNTVLPHPWCAGVVRAGHWRQGAGRHVQAGFEGWQR